MEIQKEEFINACRILFSTDRSDLEKFGVIETGEAGKNEWRKFNNDPLLFVMKLSDEKLSALWQHIESRQPNQQQPQSYYSNTPAL